MLWGNQAVKQRHLLYGVSSCFLQVMSSLLYDFQEEKIVNFFLLPFLVLPVKAEG